MASPTPREIGDLTGVVSGEQRGLSSPDPGWLVPCGAAVGPLCLCGTPMSADVHQALWLCPHCGRAFCRDCGGMMARVGGCDTCTVCGMGMCA
jgi:hypothetical protein